MRLSAIRRIVDTPTVPGTTATLEILGEFAPLTQTPESEQLFDSLCQAARRVWPHRRGRVLAAAAPISGFTAGVGCPTICAVGPVGGNAHTPEEYLEIDSIVPRAQAMALAILRLPLDGIGLTAAVSLDSVARSIRPGSAVARHGQACIARKGV